ncbi:hypothetical protein KC19_2G184700 [Ceratodon purpureus]|uniref:Uncharacterized protein n=1 Tax=Ceratodon purpureus TaxID=3225 RepID=A0A8T0IXR8_CERPU|nr:hypothetical protein KC19_2G184700 [Ceratodon purpureus]
MLHDSCVCWPWCIHSISCLASAVCGVVREKVRFEEKRAPAGLQKWAELPFSSSALEERLEEVENCGEWIVGDEIVMDL